MMKRLEERVRQLGPQIEQTKKAAGLSLWTYVFEGRDVATCRQVPDGPQWWDGTAPSAWPTLQEVLAQSGVTPADQNACIRVVQACADGASPEFEVEYPRSLPDGSIGWQRARGTVSRDANGDPSTLTGVSIDITSQKRIEQRFELALLGSKACTWDFELPDGTQLTARAAYTNVFEMLGYSSADDTSEFPDALALRIRPEDQPQFLAEVQAHLDGTDREWYHLHRARSKDGDDRWHLARGVTQRDPTTGRATRLTGITIDITERVRIEQALRESEQWFRGMFENAAVGMVLHDGEGRIIEVNDTLCRFTGYSRDELVGASYMDFADDVTAAHTRLGQLLDGEVEKHEVDNRIVRKDGSVVWSRITYSMMVRGDGPAARILAILQDVTQRKALEDDLQKTKERLELGIRGSGTTIFDIELTTDSLEDAAITMINGWELLGYQAATAPTDVRNVGALLIHPEDLPRALEQAAAYLGSGASYLESEYRIRHADGSFSWRLSRGRELRDARGRPTRLLGSMVDITERKRIEEELQRARQVAESANRAKDDFLANVSHEIRTPMNAILGMTELALDASGTAHQRQLLSTVKVAAKNLLHVINDLLDFSKITADKLALDHAEFALRAEVSDTMRALAARAHRKGLAIASRIRPDVPDSYVGDAGRLRQVLMNLVGNAITFTERGAVHLDVAIEPGTAPTDDAVSLQFTVRDTGVGIALEKHAAIFRAFEQEDPSTTRRFGGTGLGLTISAQLAALMGGRITVDSEPGRGSSFVSTGRFVRSRKLHLQRPPVAHAGETPPPAPATANAGRPLHILVAEDNELNVALIEELLRRRGHRVTLAGDGRTALDLATHRDATYDLVLLDLHMPEMDGFEVARGIRDHERVTNQHLPLVALTARSSQRDRERALAAGMDDFLSKPIELEALWRALDLIASRCPRRSGGDLRSSIPRPFCAHAVAMP